MTPIVPTISLEALVVARPHERRCSSDSGSTTAAEARRRWRKPVTTASSMSTRSAGRWKRSTMPPPTARLASPLGGPRLAAHDAGEAVRPHPLRPPRRPAPRAASDRGAARNHPSRAVCRTHRTLLEAVGALELDLHQHVHEENNVLFPRVRAASAGDPREAAVITSAPAHGQAMRAGPDALLPCCESGIVEQTWRRAKRSGT